MGLSAVALATWLLLAVVFDARQRRLPNWLTVGGAIAALLAALASRHPWGLGWPAVVTGAALGLAVSLPFFARRRLAGGDVKLLAALGSSFGSGLLWVWAVGSLTLGLHALCLLVAGRSTTHEAAAVRLPYGSHLGGAGLALMAAAWLGER